MGENCRELQAICLNFICECLVLVDKDRPIALIREMLYLAIHENFHYNMVGMLLTLFTTGC